MVLIKILKSCIKLQCDNETCNKKFTIKCIRKNWKYADIFIMSPLDTYESISDFCSQKCYDKGILSHEQYIKKYNHENGGK